MTSYQTEIFIGNSIAIDTLQEINADLGAEMMESHQKRHSPPNVQPLSKIDPETTEHMRFYKQYLHFYATLGKLFGNRVTYDWIPKRHFKVWITTSLLGLGVCLILYSIYHHFSYGDYRRILEPLAIGGATISCCQKWYNHLMQFPKIYSLLFSPRKLCLENVSGKRADIICNGLRKTCKTLKAYAAGVSAFLLCYVAVPAKYYIVDNILVPMIPFEYPFDQTTNSGIILSLFIQGIIGLYGFIATITYGSGFLICISNYTFLVELIGEDFADLDEMWNGSSSTYVAVRHAFLRNICKKLQDTETYLDITRDIFEWKLFVYFALNFLGQVICLFEIKDSDWIPGYTIALVLFTEMMFYCVVGTQLSIAGDKLCNAISSSKWYTYDIESQRLLVLMLHGGQQPKVLTLGHLGPLDVVTLIQFVKGIYSYYTVMLDVL